MSINEEKLEKAIAQCLDPKNKISIYKVSKLHGVDYRTLKRRVNGGRSMKQAAIDARLLSPEQESVLEARIIFLCLCNIAISGPMVREMAGKMTRRPENFTPARNWLTAFFKRREYLTYTRAGKIELNRRRDGPVHLINLFFELYEHFIKKFNVAPNNIWTIEECGIQIGDTMEKCNIVAHQNARNVVSYDTREQVTVLELISATGTVGDPLFTYKGEQLMESWFPKDVGEPGYAASSDSASINKELFMDWFRQCTSFADSDSNVWKILLLDGHPSYTQNRFFNLAISRKFIPLFFPTHVTHILELLDTVPSSVSGQLQREAFDFEFSKGWTTNQKMFFETYFSVRRAAFASDEIKNAFQKAGLAPLNREIAMSRIKDQHNLDFAVVESPVDEQPVQEDDDDSDAEDFSKISTEILSMTWRSARATLLRLGWSLEQINIYQAVWRLHSELRTKMAYMTRNEARIQKPAICPKCKQKREE